MKLKLIVGAVALAQASSAQAQTAEVGSNATVFTQGGVAAAWARGITGANARIGIIDNGFDLTNVDLRGQVLAAKNFAADSVTWGTHGTMMATIAAGANNGAGMVGLAPGAKLLLAQAGPGGTNTGLTARAVTQALDWLSLQGATVINMSFGTGYSNTFINSVKFNTRTGIYYTNLPTTDPSISAYAVAANRNSVLVASAGNQGLSYVQMPAIFATQTNANNQLVLSGRMLIVGSVDTNNRITTFTNRAGHLCQNAVGSTCYDRYLTQNFYVVAPATVTASLPDQLGQRNAVGPITGTSPSAAYVSGGIALLRQAWPQLRAEQLVDLVLTTARDLGPAGTDAVYGRGLVDFDSATRPQGPLRVAGRSYMPGSATNTGASLTGTAIVAAGGLAQTLKTSAVLEQTQVLDQYDRNYRADLRSAVLAANYFANPDSPWLGWTAANRLDFALTDRLSATVYPGQTGSAAQVNYGQSGTEFQLQLGSITELQGFLGTYGQGALGFGTSQTAWLQLGLEQRIADKTAIMAKFGQGQTRVGPSAVSLLSVNGPVVSQSWRLGVGRSKLFSERDQLQITVGQPVSVRRGQITVSGVTGYEYTETDTGVQVNPVVQTETVNLRSNAQEYNLAINYRRSLTATSVIGYNLVQRFNQGGVAGSIGTVLTVQFTATN